MFVANRILAFDVASLIGDISSMETLKRIFFEDPTVVYVIAGVVLLVLIAVWFRRRTRGATLYILAALMLAAFVFVLQMLVTTDREQIGQALEEITVRVNAADIESLDEFIDESYTGLWAPKRQLLESGQTMFKRANVRDVRITDKKIEVSGDRADVRVITAALADDPFTGNMPVTIPIQWRLKWIKTDGRWKLREIVSMKPINPMQKGD